MARYCQTPTHCQCRLRRNILSFTITNTNATLPTSMYMSQHPILSCFAIPQLVLPRLFILPWMISMNPLQSTHHGELCAKTKQGI